MLSEKIVAMVDTNRLKVIDDLLVSTAEHRWRKASFVIGIAMMKNTDRHTGDDDNLYATRLRKLVEQGVLEMSGDPEDIQASEVRLFKVGER